MDRESKKSLQEDDLKYIQSLERSVEHFKSSYVKRIFSSDGKMIDTLNDIINSVEQEIKRARAEYDQENRGHEVTKASPKISFYDS